MTGPGLGELLDLSRMWQAKSALLLIAAAVVLGSELMQGSVM